MRIAGAIVIALAMLIALTGVVTADLGVVAVPELQTVLFTTTINANGNVMGTDALTWQLSSNGLVTPYTDPVLAAGQVQYSTAYDANIVALNGKTTLARSVAADTRNKVVSQSNIKATTQLNYVETGAGGNIVGSENLMLDGVSKSTPAYCNIVQMGGKYDLVIGSVTAQADELFVHTSATSPVVMNYQMAVKPMTIGTATVPAAGSAGMYVKTHTQGSRLGTASTKNEDVSFSHVSSVQGSIKAYSDAGHWESKVNSVSLSSSLGSWSC